MKKLFGIFVCAGVFALSAFFGAVGSIKSGADKVNAFEGLPTIPPNSQIKIEYKDNAWFQDDSWKVLDIGEDFQFIQGKNPRLRFPEYSNYGGYVGLQATFQITLLNPNLDWGWRDYENQYNERGGASVALIEFRESYSKTVADEIIAPENTRSVASVIRSNGFDTGVTQEIPRMVSFGLAYNLSEPNSPVDYEIGRGVYTVNIFTNPDTNPIDELEYGRAGAQFAFDIIVGHEPAKFDPYFVFARNGHMKSFETSDINNLENGGKIYMGFNRYTIADKAEWQGSFGVDPMLYNNVLWQKAKVREIETDSAKIDRTTQGIPKVTGLPSFLHAIDFVKYEDKEYATLQIVAGEKVKYGTYKISFNVVYRYYYIATDGTNRSSGYILNETGYKVETEITISKPNNGGINFWWAIAGIGMLGCIGLLWYLISNFALSNQAAHERKLRAREIEAAVKRAENMDKMRRENVVSEDEGEKEPEPTGRTPIKPKKPQKPKAE